MPSQSENDPRLPVDERDRESGSAVAEFVLIATPLLIPVLLFFLSMNATAMQEMQIENLARQSLRAFVTADSLAEGHQRIKYVLDRFKDLESEFQSNSEFTYEISCGGDKCLSPGTRVRIELFRRFKTESGEIHVRKASATATSIVEKWQEQ